MERRPFKAILDIGITSTTTGNRVFGALKGAVDGGLLIPHSTRRFPGYVKEGETEKYNAATHRERILGVHVDKYMKALKDDSNDEYVRKFSKWDECLKKNGVAKVEDLYKKIHDQVRKNPDQVNSKKRDKPNRTHAKFRVKRLNCAEKR